ncbi:MAG: glycoside hydrolase TIM-barrel-like domain-containing protein [Candidatus Eisenbacteria bacterium]
MFALPAFCILLVGPDRPPPPGGAGQETVRLAQAGLRFPETQDRYSRDGKIRGVNFVAGRRFSEDALRPLLRDHVEWLVLGPFGWQENATSTEVRIATRDVMWSESDSGIVTIARLARAHGMRTMLKPQIWLTRPAPGTWLADIDAPDEAGRTAWFESYRRFVLHYAGLAETAGVEVLCVGAELHRSVKRSPRDWERLIADVRAVYHGRLTYAANWYEEITDVPFWNRLDYIGVQAYYPLTDRLEPRVDDLVAAWHPIAASLERLSVREGRPVLFTEVGWKSTPDAAARPWEWGEHMSGTSARVSTGTQARAYEAFFRAFWSRPWFAGAFVWKWYANHGAAGGPDDIDFTPQNKPAESVLARWFGDVSSTPARKPGGDRAR